MPARIVALHVTPARRAPLTPLERARLIEETGVEGDRHAKHDSRRQVLLVEQEVLDRFHLAPGDLREQVTVAGLDLNALPFGTRFHAGDAVLEIAGPCAPCPRMNEVREGLEQGLVGCRGRFARVVTAGSLAIGDAVTVIA
jgi:MOSC domain-containing protein YiiM